MKHTFEAVTICLLVMAMVSVFALMEHFTKNPVVADSAVETIEFLTKDNLSNTAAVYIQTDEAAIAANRVDVLFVKSGNDEYHVVERKIKSSFRIIGESPYTVYVPDDRVKELTQDYAKTFGETLEIGTEE